MQQSVSPYSPGYKRAFVFSTIILLAGFILQWTIRLPTPQISHPYSTLTLLVFSLFVVIFYLGFAKFQIVKFLSSIPFSLAAISCIVALSLIAGIIPQQPTSSFFINRLGLNRITASWPFAFSLIALLISLGLTVLKRVWPFSLSNIGFLANHFGLWLTIAVATFGSGDLERVRINLIEGEGSSIGHSSNGNYVQLPFFIKLNDFKLEEYLPEITLGDSKSGAALKENNRLVPLRIGETSKLRDWAVTVLEFLPDAQKSGDKYVPALTANAIPAALIAVKNLKTGDTTNGWIAIGGLNTSPEFFTLNSQTVIALVPPRPRKFVSTVSIFTKGSGRIENIDIEVNRPFHLGDFSLYQVDYNQQQGKWSKESGLEAIYDPWISWIYVGLALLTLGTLHMLITIKNIAICNGN